MYLGQVIDSGWLLRFGPDLIVHDSVRCPPCFRFKSFSVSFRLKRSAVSLLTTSSSKNVSIKQSVWTLFDQHFHLVMISDLI